MFILEITLPALVTYISTSCLTEKERYSSIPMLLRKEKWKIYFCLFDCECRNRNNNIIASLELEAKKPWEIKRSGKRTR